MLRAVYAFGRKINDLVSYRRVSCAYGIRTLRGCAGACASHNGGAGETPGPSGAGKSSGTYAIGARCADLPWCAPAVCPVRLCSRVREKTVSAPHTVCSLRKTASFSRTIPLRFRPSCTASRRKNDGRRERSGRRSMISLNSSLPVICIVWKSWKSRRKPWRIRCSPTALILSALR